MYWEFNLGKQSNFSAHYSKGVFYGTTRNRFVANATFCILPTGKEVASHTRQNCHVI